MNNNKILHILIAVLFVSLSACGGGGGGGSSSTGSSGSNGGGGGTPPAAGSEGTLSSPVTLTQASMPYSGKVSVNGLSYYLISGLAGGASYSITLSNVSTPIIPFLYSSDTTSNLQSCFYTAVSSTSSCIVQASSSGTIFITTASYSLTGSSTYTLSMSLAVDAGQGVPTSPVTITSPNSYSGTLTSGVSTTTSDPGNSGYYLLSGLTPGNRYGITLSGITVGADLFVSQNSFGAVACSRATGDTSPKYCEITAKGNSILIRIAARDQGNFTISENDLGPATPILSQGTPSGGEMVLTVDQQTILDNGSVNDGKSYYTVTGIVPGQAYSVYLHNLTDNVNLYVYRDSSYTQLACSSTLEGTKNDSCNAIPDANGQLWIVADGSTALANLGSTYAIGVQRVVPLQGSSAAPQIIDASTQLPYRVSAGNKQKSYYKISGLPANTSLMASISISHSVESSYPTMSVYPATGFGAFPSCNTNGAYYGNCNGTTNSQGELFVSVDASTAAGATAYLDVKAMPTSEGTATAPLAKDMSTLSNKFSGMLAAGSSSYSYYALTGLAPNTNYYILASFGSGEPAALAVFNTFSGDLSTQTLTATCSQSWANLNNGCTATSDASGRLWVSMGGWSVNIGAYFNIEALPVPVSKGSMGAPVNITANLPYRSTVGSDSSSYYMVTGLTANTEYLFSKYDTSSGEDLAVYNDSAFTSEICNSYFGNPGREANCRGKPTGSTVYILISNTGYMTAPSYHYIDISPVANVEGTPASPVIIGSSHGGSVNLGASFYRATLAPNTTYTVSLTSVSGDPDLYVFNDPTMSGSASCSSIKGNNQTESCQATSDSNGYLWIVVDGNLSKGGASYLLQIN